MFIVMDLLPYFLLIKSLDHLLVFKALRAGFIGSLTFRPASIGESVLVLYLVFTTNLEN